MFSYFDKLFVRIYLWYIAKKENDIPALYSILIISLFQTFNALAIIFLVGGIFYKRNWVFSKIEIILVAVLALAFDYIRIYRIIGFKAILARYSTQASRKVRLHPVMYF